MSKEPVSVDRNFDDLAHRFKKNIYGGLKGDIRLAVLNRDFAEYFPFAPFVKENGEKPLRVLDAGGGQGQFSLCLAQAGHQVVICDISAEMLKLAQEEVCARGLQGNVEFVHCAIQELPAHYSSAVQGFDVVLCHAVMEWVANPPELLACLNQYLKPEGFLSLTFYNVHSLIYKNLLRTNFKKIHEQDYGGARGSLTPINPLDPESVFSWVNQLPFDVLCTSGIRVFHDYIFDHENRERDPESVIALELAFSRKLPYQMLGRYIHMLMKKPSAWGEQ
jgi:S-adenosylmethionine-dependent methyltransferase